MCGVESSIGHCNKGTGDCEGFCITPIYDSYDVLGCGLCLGPFVKDYVFG